MAPHALAEAENTKTKDNITHKIEQLKELKAIIETRSVATTEWVEISQTTLGVDIMVCVSKRRRCRAVL